jgi:putative transposase
VPARVDLKIGACDRLSVHRVVIVTFSAEEFALPAHGLVDRQALCWGALTDRWVPHDERDQVVDFVHRLSEKTEVPIVKFVEWLGVARAKFYEWRRRYGKLNEHNGKTPRDHWIEPWERQAIVDYFDTHPLEGYRRLTFMMLDDDVVAVSPATARSTW